MALAVGWLGLGGRGPGLGGCGCRCGGWWGRMGRTRRASTSACDAYRRAAAAWATCRGMLCGHGDMPCRGGLWVGGGGEVGGAVRMRAEAPHGRGAARMCRATTGTDADRHGHPVYGHPTTGTDAGLLTAAAVRRGCALMCGVHMRVPAAGPASRRTGRHNVRRWAGKGDEGGQALPRAWCNRDDWRITAATRQVDTWAVQAGRALCRMPEA